MLVYLDTAQFQHLESASASRRNDFFAVWRSLGCELALSLSHYQETAQLGPEQRIRQRLAVLNDFPTIRAAPVGAAEIMKIEIYQQLCENLGVAFEGFQSPSEVQAFAFPRTTADVVTATILETKDALVGLRRILADLSDFDNLAKKSRPKRSLKRVLAGDVTAQMALARERMDELVLSGSGIETSIDAAFEPTFQVLEQTGNARDALELIYGIDALQVRSEILDSDLRTVAYFLQFARQRVLELHGDRGIPLDPLNEALSKLDPYRCPGFSLVLAALRGRLNHPQQAKEGDRVDEDHLIFAPYVDLLVADKRTVSFLHGEAQQRAATMKAGVPASISRVATLQDVIGLISQGAGDSS